MKTVRVAAAVIKAENKNGEKVIFATERGYGEFKGGWEFPGGKIEVDETPQEAFHLSMDCFWCTVVRGNLVLKEHEASKWLRSSELNDVAWLPADITLVNKLKF